VLSPMIDELGEEEDASLSTVLWIQPPFQAGADDDGLPIDEPSANRATLDEAMASGSAFIVEEKLARLGLDEAPPAAAEQATTALAPLLGRRAQAPLWVSLSHPSWPKSRPAASALMSPSFRAACSSSRAPAAAPRPGHTATA
jgi:hypothetical protein